MRKYYKINWEKGMRLSEQAFTGSDNYWTSHLNKIRKIISAGNYGIVDPDFNLDGNINGDKFSVRELTCKAITPAGYLIDIDSEHFTENNPDREVEFLVSSEAYLNIAINPFYNIPVGDINPLEQINRYPYSEPKYELFFTTEQSKKENACPIAKFKYGERDMSFIPPCVYIDANNELKGIYRDFKERLSTLYNLLLEKRKAPDYSFLDFVLVPVSSLYVEITEFKDRSPVDLFVAMKKVIFLYFTLSQINNSVQVSPEIYSVCTKEYNHQDIAECLKPALAALVDICIQITGLSPVEKLEPPVIEPIIELEGRKRRDIII
jgi:predicted component of type VI protein secretion system